VPLFVGRWRMFSLCAWKGGGIVPSVPQGLRGFDFGVRCIGSEGGENAGHDFLVFAFLGLRAWYTSKTVFISTRPRWISLIA
jgi:hypothetical protein